MSLRELEDRITSLESQVAELRSLLRERSATAKDWRRAVEKYAGDEGMLSICAEAAKIREADRKRVKQARAKSRTGKK